ncbi:MAG: BON domain-containing protein [Pyrinomonadaceae bacterium]|nr:BON domain-containing protein [Pyrinomonadaceae bacterium]
MKAQKLSLLAVLVMCIALVAGACGEAARGDAAIKTDVDAKVKASAGAAGVTSTVKEGVVTLSGKVADQTARNSIESAAKSVQGVKSVTNNLEFGTGVPPGQTTTNTAK